MSNLNTIDDVLTELDSIVNRTIEENSPLGIFAWFYWRTTKKVAEGIRQQRFENNIRMERFDVAFARIYIKAFNKFSNQKPVSSVWDQAFSATSASAENNDLLIIQHLLLGMNAHINLDLGIAADRITPDGEIKILEKDFMIINHLLEELIDEMQSRLSRVSPLMFVLDLMGQRSDEKMVNWSITKARSFAWNFACQLDGSTNTNKQRIINQADRHISEIGDCVAQPSGILFPKLLSVIRFFEEKNTRTVIEKLKA